MADENMRGEEERKDSFVKGLGGAMARKALVPLAASAATAVTAYVTRKSSELWREKVQPKVQEKGGGRGVAREALEKVSEKFGGRGSETLSALADRLGSDGGSPQSRPRAAEEAAASANEPQKDADESDERRAEERRQRRQRRQQRQRALQQSRSS